MVTRVTFPADNRSQSVWDGSIFWSLTWWRHQMGTFSALLALCEGNSPVTGEFPPQRPVTRSFHVFHDLRLNKRLNKQSCAWWFETPSRSLWRHCSASKWGTKVNEGQIYRRHILEYHSFSMLPVGVFSLKTDRFMVRLDSMFVRSVVYIHNTRMLLYQFVTCKTNN